MEKIINYINSVRGRTEEEKKRAVITWTIVIIILIFIIWVITFSLSALNVQDEETRLRAEAISKAKTTIETSTASALTKEDNSWRMKIGQFVADSADSISAGFWTIGSWLHK